MALLVSPVSPTRHNIKKATGFAPVGFILPQITANATLSDYRRVSVHHLVKQPLEIPERVDHARAHRRRQA